MQNFIYTIDTKVYFGKGQMNFLPEEIKKYGKHVLLVYGGGSIKRNGLYQKIMELLEHREMEITEFGNVEPNPTVDTVQRGIQLCRQKKIDVILAVGGGSVIDCGKAIGAGTYYEGSPWDLVKNPDLLQRSLPMITVLTMAASGSEMDEYAVLTNEDTLEKQSMHGACIRPRVSFLDPTNTFTLPKRQTAAGVADIMSHLIDCYFKIVPGAFMQERVIEALLKTCIHYGPVLMEEPDNYEARANIMWVSSWAVNGLVSLGNAGQSPVHPIEHQLSAVYKVTHGEGLAVLTPHWMDHILEKYENALDLFVSYGVNVFEIQKNLEPKEIAHQAIRQTAKVFEKMELPKNLRELGIKEKDQFEIMAEKAVNAGAGRTYFAMNKEDVIKIYEKAY